MSDDKVVSFAPPHLNEPNETSPEKVPEDQPSDQPRTLTRGERLVGVDFNPSGDFGVKLAKHRAARAIDQLGNMPLKMIAVRRTPDSDPVAMIDFDHKLIIEAAIQKQVEACMMTVKALTWGK